MHFHNYSFFQTQKNYKKSQGTTLLRQLAVMALYDALDPLALRSRFSTALRLLTS